MENTLTQFMELRQSAEDKYGAIPEPSFTYGLNILYPISSVDIPSEKNDGQELDVVVNGIEGALTMSIQEGLAHPEYAKALLSAISSTDFEEDKLFHWLHSIADGVLVVVTSDCSTEEALNINLSSETDTRSRVVILVEEGVSANLVLHQSSTEAIRQSVLVDVIAGKDSVLTISDTQHHADESSVFRFTRLHGESGSTISYREFLLSGAFVRSHVSANLRGEGAATDLTTTFLGTDSTRFDLYTVTHHYNKSTKAMLTTRGVLGGKAKAIHRSLIDIRKEATQAVAKQKSETILLSEDAEVDTIPNLEIATDAVECGHSATVSDIDEGSLFYLSSRGVSEKEAKSLLLSGFLNVTDEHLLPAIDACIEKLV